MRLTCFASFLTWSYMLFSVAAQPLVRTDIPYCRGSAYKLALNCTNAKFDPQAACAIYTPSTTVFCDDVPVFFSADSVYQIVYFSPSNPDISSWANGMAYVALRAHNATTADPGVSQCSFESALALKSIELKTNARNFAETLLSSPFGWKWFDMAVNADEDAGIKEICYAPATPPFPPPQSPPPAPPLINGNYEWHCDPYSDVVFLRGCRADLPGYIPTDICANYTLTRDYIPSDCFGRPIFQSLTNPSMFMWWVDKNLTNTVNDYFLVGDGKSLCQYASGVLALKIQAYTASYNWLQAVKMSENFTFYNATSNKMTQNF